MDKAACRGLLAGIDAKRGYQEWETELFNEVDAWGTADSEFDSVTDYCCLQFLSCLHQIISVSDDAIARQSTGILSAQSCLTYLKQIGGNTTIVGKTWPLGRSLRASFALGMNVFQLILSRLFTI